MPPHQIRLVPPQQEDPEPPSPGVGFGAVGPGFAVAVTEPRDQVVRVHLIGDLTVASAPLLPQGLSSFLGPMSPPSPAGGIVLFDLSALGGLDGAGMAALNVAQNALLGLGWAVQQALPQGSTLRLLDSAARAGWSPPELSCTDILRWHGPRPPTAPDGPAGRGW